MKQKFKHLKAHQLKQTSFSKASLLVFVLVFAGIGGYILTRSFAAGLPSIYIAQTAAGTADGSSCANAKDVTYFNTAANWGTGSTQIGPGTTVHLCETITTALSVQGSGVSGSPITIYFEPNAKLSSPAFAAQWWGGGALAVFEKDYITIDGGTNGLIENTANGTGLANQLDSVGVGAVNANHFTVKNLTIKNIYVHTSPDDTNGYGTGIEDNCDELAGFTDFTATNNTIDNAYIGIHADYGNVTDINWSSNTITHANWGLQLGDRNASSTASNINVFNNHVSLFSNWDQTNDDFHHNGFYGWAESGGQLSGVNVYGNTIGPDYGQYATAGVFTSGNVANFKVYNNLFVANAGDAPTNGFVTLGSNPGHSGVGAYNNTVVGGGAGFGVIVSGQNSYQIKNNLITNVNTAIFFNYTSGVGTLDADYNLAYGLKAGEEFAVSTDGTANFYTFAGWRGLGHDVHGLIADPLLDSNNHLGAGSPAIGAAVNLSSLFTTDKDGNTRPASGAWDIGAYKYVPAANVWVSTTGNDSTCVRGDSSKPCATPKQACTIAAAGDTVLVEAGTYSNGFNLSGCHPASAITFINNPGTNVFFAGDSSISDTTNVTIQGDNIGHGVGFSLSKVGISGTDAAPTSDITWNSVNLYCQNQSPWTVITSSLTDETACNSALSITGNVSDFTWNGGDQEDWATCYTSCTNNVGLNPNANGIFDGNQTNRPTNITIENVTFKNYYSLDNNGSDGDHSENWVIMSGSHLTFKNNSWTDCAPPASTGYAVNNSCNTAYIFFGQSSNPNGTYQTPTPDYVTFEGNIISPGHGQAAVHFDYDYPQGYEFHTSWLYNTIDGAFLIKGNNSSTPMDPGSVVLTGTNMSFVGNIAPKASYDSCFSGALYSHNLWFRSDGTAISCGAGDVEKDLAADTAIFTAPGDDFHLLVGSGGIDAGEATYCPSTDLFGTARPQGSACDIGAVEYVSGTGGGTTPGDLNSDGHVNVLDLSMLLSHWQSTDTTADINASGKVDILDLSILLSHYGT